MFLTTELSLAGKNYNPLRVIYATETAKSGKSPDTAVETILNQLYAKAMGLRADGVIGVHISISTDGGWFTATVMGTAIKFQ